MSAPDPLTWKTVTDMFAEMDIIVRPWAPLIGLVELLPSEYVERGKVYAIDPSRSGLFPWPEPVKQGVVLHSGDVDTARDAARVVTSRSMSDEELAAYLYWAAHKTPKA